MKKIAAAAGMAVLAALTLAGCASPFGGVFADESPGPAAPATSPQYAAPIEPSSTAAEVQALDLASVVQQTNDLLTPVISECVTGVEDAVPRTATSDSRVTCAGQIGPLAGDLTGGMIGRDVTVDASSVAPFPGVQLLADKSTYASMTSGDSAVVPMASTGVWAVAQSVTGTTSASTTSGFDVVDQIDAEVLLVADVSVDAAGAITAIVVTGTTTTTTAPKAVL